MSVEENESLETRMDEIAKSGANDEDINSLIRWMKNEIAKEKSES